MHQKETVLHYNSCKRANEKRSISSNWNFLELPWNLQCNISNISLTSSHWGFSGTNRILLVFNANLSLLIMYNLEQYIYSDFLQLNFLKISEAERKVIMAREKLLSLSGNMHENKKDFKCTCTLYHIMVKKQLRGTW